MSESDGGATPRDRSSRLVAELASAGIEDAELIGRGGFGVVYRCAQRGLDRSVAVKVLSGEPSEESLARFAREQRALGRLTGHPNIIGVLLVGETESGLPYIVMPYHVEGSLDAGIRRAGTMSITEVARVGERIAGALDAAHRVGIVHRDVKPENILFTDFGEPTLADFGIARIVGAFRTTDGTVTGSPAYTAPEVLSGGPPTPASDVYGLGATLFSALTGHAAFERRADERLVSQFLRITSQPVPDLRERGVPEEISEAIEAAMGRDPRDRPSAHVLRTRLAQIGSTEQQSRPEPALGGDTSHSYATGRRTSGRHRPSSPSRAHSPLNDLASFVGRRSELREIRSALASARLITLAGMGGVGKTRLALQTATAVDRDFRDGVWLVELGDLRDPSLVIELVATVIGVQDRTSSELLAVLTEALTPMSALLVLDNCEQVLGAVAELVPVLLHRCPQLKVLVTSRETIGVGGEKVIRVSPMKTPEPPWESAPTELARSDAVRLFVERAAAVSPGFTLTLANCGAVADICAQLDGIPLAVELAAARMRVLSLEQIRQRLGDRFTLLRGGTRDAPTRQQALLWSIDWTYDLCTSSEQRLWSQLSTFAGGFELDAAEYVCGTDADTNLIETLISLVDRSIVVRQEESGVVRLRLLETLKLYALEKFSEAERAHTAKRHRDWYRRLAFAAADEWMSPRQDEWSARLARELPNLREAFEYDVAAADDCALLLPVALSSFWIARGSTSEGRRWVDRALALSDSCSPLDHVKAAYASSVMAGFQGDLDVAMRRVEESRAVEQRHPDPTAHIYVVAGEGFVALQQADFDRARVLLEEVVTGSATITGSDGLKLQCEALLLLGWISHSRGHIERALQYHEKVLAVSQSAGENLYKTYALWATGVDTWKLGERQRAVAALEQGLRQARRTGGLLMVATCLQALAWIAGEQGDVHRAGTLMGAADALGRRLGSSPVLFPNLYSYQEEFDASVDRAANAKEVRVSRQEGYSMNTDTAIRFALGEHAAQAPTSGRRRPILTPREFQVAGLIVEGLSNKAIAGRLGITSRTVDGHVEHIFTKLGLTSRVAVAEWMVEYDTGS